MIASEVPFDCDSRMGCCPSARSGISFFFVMLVFKSFRWGDVYTPRHGRSIFDPISIVQRKNNSLKALA